MHWNDTGVVFARPIRWIVALFGNEIINFDYAGVTSSNITYGHRFFGKAKARLRDSDSFFKTLDQLNIVWDNNKRKHIILTALQRRNWHPNYALLSEVSNLVESPHFIEGVFEKEYLSLPQEVLLASMAKHQRIFCLKGKNNEITNRFLAVVNGNYKGKKRIRKNLEDVLAARLKDAMFFYEADTKKPLSEWAEGLKQVIFDKRLGTLKDKSERLNRIAKYLLPCVGIDNEEKKDLMRAIVLCKADLLTSMVSEFPSLQGTIGSYYAQESGESELTARTIREHYLPSFADDKLPETKTGIVCSLADKIDNIICYFKLGKFPKGSWDIYALRRQAIGIISIIIKKKIFLSIDAVFEYVYDIAPGDYNKDKLKILFREFFRERFVSLSKEKLLYRYDVIDAVLSSSSDDLYEAYLRLEALTADAKEQYFESTRRIIERTNNIIRSVKDKSRTDVHVSLFAEPEERVVYDKFNELKNEFMELCSEKDYQQATRLFGEQLDEAVGDYFDKVMVNVHDKQLRSNRLSLLCAINKLYVDNIADLSKIVTTNKQQ
jgi:glycyl-tRNA synthetase beta chain